MSENTRKVLSLKGNETEAKTKISERLHKVLAQAGLGSRRRSKQRIAQGLVKVNGEVAQTGHDRSPAATASNSTARSSSPPR